MSRKEELEAMNGLQLMDLIDKYKLDPNCKRTEAIKLILEHEGQPTKAKRGPRNKANTKLKAVRVASGMTQKALAEEAGINQRTLQFYEQGAKLIDSASLETILRVAISLNCKIEDIIENDNILDLFTEYRSK